MHVILNCKILCKISNTRSFLWFTLQWNIVLIPSIVETYIFTFVSFKTFLSVHSRIFFNAVWICEALSLICELFKRVFVSLLFQPHNVGKWTLLLLFLFFIFFLPCLFVIRAELYQTSRLTITNTSVIIIFRCQLIFYPQSQSHMHTRIYIVFVAFTFLEIMLQHRMLRAWPG